MNRLSQSKDIFGDVVEIVGELRVWVEEDFSDSVLLALKNEESSPSAWPWPSVDSGPRHRSMWLEKEELGQRLAARGVGEELVQDEELLASQQEQRLIETEPLPTDLHRKTTCGFRGKASISAD